MPIVLSNFWMEAVQTYKETFLNGTPTRFVSIRLFKNPLPGTLDCATVLSAFTTCNFDGYADQACHTWGAPAAVGGCVWRILNPFLTWTPTGTTTPNDVYGYAIYDELTDQIYWFEVFAGGPITVGSTLVPFLVFPRLDEKSTP